MLESGVAGFMKYNPVSAGSAKLRMIAESGEIQAGRDPDFNPYDEEELPYIEGYPPELFIDARNREARERIKAEYDMSVRVDETTVRQHSGKASVCDGVACANSFGEC